MLAFAFVKLPVLVKAWTIFNDRENGNWCHTLKPRFNKNVNTFYLATFADNARFNEFTDHFFELGSNYELHLLFHQDKVIALSPLLTSLATWCLRSCGCYNSFGFPCQLLLLKQTRNYCMNLQNMLRQAVRFCIHQMAQLSMCRSRTGLFVFF